MIVSGPPVKVSSIQWFTVVGLMGLPVLFVLETHLSTHNGWAWRRPRKFKPKKEISEGNNLGGCYTRIVFKMPSIISTVIRNLRHGVKSVICQEYFIPFALQYLKKKGLICSYILSINSLIGQIWRLFKSSLRLSTFSWELIANASITQVVFQENLL